MTDAFDPNDPEIVVLMHRKAEAQTRALIESDERLQVEPNMDRFRMLAAARAADPTSILDEDDDLARIRPAFPEVLVSPTGTKLGFYGSAPVRTLPGSLVFQGALPIPDPDPAYVRRILGFPDDPKQDPPPGSIAAAFAEFAAAMEKVADQIKQVLVDVGHHFSDLQKRISDLGILDPPATNRLRHGHASICSRHGPTKGGLCRRCNR